MQQKQMTSLKAAIIFICAALYFFVLLVTLLPFLKTRFMLHPALCWFITGYFLFIPLFLYAIFSAKGEGNNSVYKIAQALNIRRFTKNDWFYAAGGTASVFVLTGLIMLCSSAMHTHWETHLLNTTPWFLKMAPFQGTEKLFLLVWLPMFFFNIVGEEILWRGYIQPRLRVKYAWLFCAFLWALFHLPFGWDLLIILAPCLLIIPYVFSKTHNTLVGIFIHAIYNGPMFVLVALGVIK